MEPSAFGILAIMLGRLSSLFLTSLLLVAFSGLGCGTSDLGAPTYEQSEPVQEEPVAGPVEVEPPPPPISRNPFVWRVSKGGRVSHLMGTIHVGVSLDEALTPNLQDAAANARLLMLEIDPREMRPEVLMAAARMPEGERQDGLYPPSVWHEIANELNTKINEQTLRVMRPWFTMILYLQALVGQAGGSDAPEGMDLALFRMATDTGVELRPLETVQAQIDAMAGVPDETIVRMMTESIQEGRATGELDQLLSLYRGADFEAVETFMKRSRARDHAPEFHTALIDRRNEAWMEPLLRELEGGNVFVAVGLGHLVGEQGLLARLRAAGYTVERAR